MFGSVSVTEQRFHQRLSHLRLPYQYNNLSQTLALPTRPNIGRNIRFPCLLLPSCHRTTLTDDCLTTKTNARGVNSVMNSFRLVAKDLHPASDLAHYRRNQRVARIFGWLREIDDKAVETGLHSHDQLCGISIAPYSLPQAKKAQPIGAN